MGTIYLEGSMTSHPCLTLKHIPDVGSSNSVGKHSRAMNVQLALLSRNILAKYCFVLRLHVQVFLVFLAMVISYDRGGRTAMSTLLI